MDCETYSLRLPMPAAPATIAIVTAAPMPADEVRRLTELRALEVPAPITRDWNKGLALLERAADKLTESEQLAAAGDFERAGDAQGEALWSLEAKAQEHFNAMHVPFRVCWVE